MKCKKCVEKIILICLCTFFFGCSAFAKEKAPYIAGGDFVLDSETSDFQVAGIELYFYNRSDKAVKEFTVVFYLFDEDGEPISTGKSNIVLTVKKEIPAESAFKQSVSLDKYFLVVPDYQYSVEYLYVSSIVYEDGTTWKDPFGMMAF